MLRSAAARWILAVVVVIAVLGLLRFKPWRRGNSETARQHQTVGFLPVT